jgi:hypothetical protein
MITVTDYLAAATALDKECNDLVVRKNHDYAGNGDFFKCFAVCQQMGIADTEIGIMVRLSDKFSRLANLLKSSAEVDESVADTIRDAINYLKILYAYREFGGSD